jgi:predicted amidohydrolase YtcJ
MNLSRRSRSYRRTTGSTRAVTSCVNSTGWGVTIAINAGGAFQNYPEDYQIIQQLHQNGELTVRIAYNLFTQKPKGELADFQNWGGKLTALQGDDYFRRNGAGDKLVYCAADFEDFLKPRPDLPGIMEQELKGVVNLLAKNPWPFRLHATYDETITRALNVYEEVNRAIPLRGLHWFIDHAETIAQRSLDRTAALGGNIAIQLSNGVSGRVSATGMATPKRTSMLGRNGPPALV